ncbi:hypothetical protein P8605_08895 [Streptomyces sp. T-3]|nr:hypothetical protein [Streptomyces sp. T-3]
MPRWSAVLGLAAIVTLAPPLTTPEAAAAEELGGEPFTGATVDPDQWYGGPYVKDAPAGWACLTASTAEPKPLEGCRNHDGMPAPDKPGEGALRLTSDATFQHGYVISKNALPARDSMKFTVDFGIYKPGRTGEPGGGIALMLLDGSAPLPVESGGRGTGLGYTGLKGGYLGIGLDVTGDFTKSGPGAKGGTPERQPNSITVRGAEATGNEMIASYRSGRRLAPSGAGNRQEARRTASLELSREGILRVLVDFHDGQPPREVIEPVDTQRIKGQPPVPKSLRVGLAASTGETTAVHEVWAGRVDTLAPALSTKLEARRPAQGGDPVEFTLTTSNDKAAGPTTGEVTATGTLPGGMKPVSATGDGWTCTVSGQTATCRRPGTGAAALQPGRAYPPVTLRADVAEDARGDTEVVSRATAPGSALKPDVSPLTVTPAGAPALTVASRPEEEVYAGEPARYALGVTNAKEAGPTGGEVTVVRTFPRGITPTAAEGDGWDCTVGGQTVTCKRPGSGGDVLEPGKTYPAVTVTTMVDADAAGHLAATTQVTTPSTADSAPTPDTIEVKPHPAKDPRLSAVTKPDGDVVAGRPATWAIGVGNAPDAGPTRATVTVRHTFPDATVPKSASGEGWNCALDDQTVTCTHPGSGDAALRPGDAYPPVKVVTQTDAAARGALTGTTWAGTEGQAESASSDDTVQVASVSTAEPGLSAKIRADGEVAQGEPATFTVTVANAPDAGPTHDVIRMTRTFPSGIVPKVASGTGWDCTIDSRTVACTRPGTKDDALQPGKSYPPLTITAAVADGATGTLRGSTGVETNGALHGGARVEDSVEIVAGDGAASGGVTCYGGLARLSLTPGLAVGDRTQSFSGSGSSAGCTTSDVKQQAAHVQVSFTGSGKGSCVPALGIPNAEITGTLHWTINGKSLRSKALGTAKLSLSGVSFEGAITDGAYNGMKVHATADWDIAGNIVPGAARCFLGGYMDPTGTLNSLRVDEG